MSTLKRCPFCGDSYTNLMISRKLSSDELTIAQMASSGVLTINEIRIALGKGGIENGDEILIRNTRKEGELMDKEQLKLGLFDQYIPDYMHHGILAYIEKGWVPGTFLSAIIENDLKNAVAYADHININLIPNYVRFFHNYAPMECWGQKGVIESWVEKFQEGGRDE